VVDDLGDLLIGQLIGEWWHLGLVFLSVELLSVKAVQHSADVCRGIGGVHHRIPGERRKRSRHTLAFRAVAGCAVAGEQRRARGGIKS
jgi:hypothetical protein